MILFFHNPLSSLLHRNYRGQQRIDQKLDRRASIKDIIEALGLPHTEIGKLSANGQEISFDHIPNNNDQVNVFPISGPSDFLSPTCLRPEPLSKLAFALDVHVGKLAALLRMCGIDSFYKHDLSDSELLKTALEESRIVLSRNRDLLKRKALTFGYLVKNHLPEKQLVEVIEFFKLAGGMQPFSRCMACNGILQKVDKNKIENRLEPLTKRYYQKFYHCPDCSKLYWSGSHKENMQNLLKRNFPALKFSLS